MSKAMTSKSIFKNSILFIALIAITFFILFKDNSISNILESLRSVNIIYVFLGILCMFLFICCEVINIRRMLKLFSYNISIFRGLKYSFVGFFFSSITPSASGGQPMQVYYRNSIKLYYILFHISSYIFKIVYK